MNFYLLEGAMDVELFIQSVSGSLKRVPGTAIFLNSRVEGVPPALLHNVKHNKILHERVIILTVRTEGVPHLPLTGRSERSAEHTSVQSLMRRSYAVFCLKKKKDKHTITQTTITQ